jgi:hypothetical protein
MFIDFLKSILGWTTSDAQPVRIHEPQRTARAVPVDQHRFSPQSQVTLEEQLEALDSVGFKLNQNVSIDDLLHSFGRDEFESEPYSCLLFMLGTEVENDPHGRYFCDFAWNLDMECIVSTGDYAELLRNIARIAGATSRVTGIEDFVSIERNEAWLRYSLDGVERFYRIPINGDWADPDTVSNLLADFEGDGKRFYGVDNGQATVWYYLTAEMAEAANHVTGNAFSLYNQVP